MSAMTNVWPGAIFTYGETFQPRPRSLAARAAGPSADMAALPFSPVKFSAQIERVFALERFARFPRLIPSPLNAIVSFP